MYRYKGVCAYQLKSGLHQNLYVRSAVSCFQTIEFQRERVLGLGLSYFIGDFIVAKAVLFRFKVFQNPLLPNSKTIYVNKTH